MRFVAIDVETANARMRSICQIGVVVFEDGRETASDVALIDPEEEFDAINVAIHGIDEARVAGAKRFTGQILLRAIDHSGINVDQWLSRVKLSLSGHPKGREHRNGDGDGPLVGETLVFTGSLSVPRREAADLAHRAGGAVDPGVTKETTILVVGDQDLLRTGGKPKSTKHLKAESLNSKGQTIRFLAESDFMALVLG